jgi:hypothetical protein
MDVSSKYFAQLRYPHPYWVKYFWKFLIDIQRVGKVRELFSFALWEIAHYVRFYHIGNQYVKFKTGAYLSIADTVAQPSESGNACSSFLAEELLFEPVAVDWKYCFQAGDGTHWGCLYSDENGLYHSTNLGESATLVHAFQQPIMSLFVSRQNALFICSGGTIYKSDDGGESFRAVLHLSTPISYFLFNNGMTELPDQTLLIGEYGSLWQGRSWQNLAFLYYSFDGGDTWQTSDFLMRQGVNKHLHIVKYCRLLNRVFLTDGDNKKQLWVNESLSHFDKLAARKQGGWRLLNRFHHQTGGHLSMAETEKAVVFGSDYLGGTNFIVRTCDGKRFDKLVLPDPYRRSPVVNMVSRKAASGDELWAVSYSCLSSDAKSVLMYSRNSGKSWTRVIEFDGTTHEVRLVSSSSDRLYISITAFSEQPAEHRHQVYILKG